MGTVLSLGLAFINSLLTSLDADVMGETSTSLNVNSTLIIIYTPALEDTGIALGYRGKRVNKDKQLIIRPNYLEYKV